MVQKLHSYIRTLIKAPPPLRLLFKKISNRYSVANLSQSSRNAFVSVVSRFLLRSLFNIC